MRERGSKLDSLCRFDSDSLVAPHAGAWIETAVARERALRAGKSLPMRERGSKRVRAQMLTITSRSRSPCGSVDRNAKCNLENCDPMQVAPHAGAWIETLDLSAASIQQPSLPMRERGSKRRYVRCGA